MMWASRTDQALPPPPPPLPPPPPPLTRQYAVNMQDGAGAECLLPGATHPAVASSALMFAQCCLNSDHQYQRGSRVPRTSQSFFGGLVTTERPTTCDLHRNVTWDEARGLCESAGARLCTVSELVAGHNAVLSEATEVHAGALGCGEAEQAGNLVWSSTVCELDASATAVATGHETTTAATHCLARDGTSPPLANHSLYSLSHNSSSLTNPNDRGLMFAQCCRLSGVPIRRDSDSVWRERLTAARPDACALHRGITRAEASALCQSLPATSGGPARLCTVQELTESAPGAGMGCDLDGAENLAWSSTACTGVVSAADDTLIASKRAYSYSRGGAANATTPAPPALSTIPAVTAASACQKLVSRIKHGACDAAGSAALTAALDTAVPRLEPAPSAAAPRGLSVRLAGAVEDMSVYAADAGGRCKWHALRGLPDDLVGKHVVKSLRYPVSEVVAAANSSLCMRANTTLYLLDHPQMACSAMETTAAELDAAALHETRRAMLLSDGWRTVESVPLNNEYGINATALSNLAWSVFRGSTRGYRYDDQLQAALQGFALWVRRAAECVSLRPLADTSSSMVLMFDTDADSAATGVGPLYDIVSRY